MKIENESRDILYELYIIQEMSAYDIGYIYKVSNVTALKYLRLKNITIRDASQARKARHCVKKAEDTCLSNYGVKHPRHAKEIRRRAEQTNLKKYGAKNPFGSTVIQEKIRQIHQNNLGVDYPGQSPTVKGKIKESIQKKYGVDNPSQSPIIQRKIMSAGTKGKKYIFPSGKEVIIQGYENIVLDRLLEKYDEADIIAGDPERIPIFDYEQNGKARKYFPDIYIPKENLIIEVKSPYTYKKYLETNLLKEKAVIDRGYRYQLCIEEKTR